MDILALRKSVGNLSGRLLVNGMRATKRFIRKTAYVPQASARPRGSWFGACCPTVLLRVRAGSRLSCQARRRLLLRWRPSAVQRSSAYTPFVRAPQEDNFVPTMTTWEVMRFYADVRTADRAPWGGLGLRKQGAGAALTRWQDIDV